MCQSFTCATFLFGGLIYFFILFFGGWVHDPSDNPLHNNGSPPNAFPHVLIGVSHVCLEVGDQVVEESGDSPFLLS